MSKNQKPYPQKKVNEEYYVSGRASQNNNLEITYDFVTIDDVKRDNYQNKIYVGTR